MDSLRAPSDVLLLDPIRREERVLLLGESGSGKTTLARKFLSSGWHPRYIVVDQKRDFPPGEGEEIITDPRDKKLWKNPPDRIIYKPEGWANSGPLLDHVLRLCYERARERGKREPFVCLVDEAFGLSKMGHTRWLSNLATQGRSLGCDLWVGSQRPMWIPTEIRSEASRIYVFHLGYDDDEEEVVKYMKVGKGIDARRGAITFLQEATANYSFIEIRKDPKQAGNRMVRRCPPVRPA